MNVAALLKSIGLEEYLPAFEAHAIDEELLPGLTPEDLRELGVDALGHRKRILEAIDKHFGRKRDTRPEPGSADPQRRQVSVLFADLVGSTPLSRELDAELLCSVMRAYHAVAKGAIDHYSGYVAQYLGDGVLAYFGFPVSHEDDPERAVRAGFAILSALKDARSGIGAPVDIHIDARVGIETGPVVVGDDLTDDSGKGISIIGETPNLASRLQSLGNAGQLIIGPRTRALLPETVVLEPLGPQRLAGVDKATEAWRVVEPGVEGGSFERKTAQSLGAFVGRDSELRELETAMADVRSGEHVCVQVTGDPGIGKSRLVHEFLRRTPHLTRVFSGHCVPFDATVFHPFAKLLSHLAEERARAGGEPPAKALRSELVAIAGEDLAPEISYLMRLAGQSAEAGIIDADVLGARIHTALVRLFQSAGRLLPTILFINDTHWIDELSEEVLDTLVRSANLLGVLLIFTCRPGYSPPWAGEPSVRHIQLGPLDDESAAALFHSKAVQARTEIDSVIQRCGGNPLFIEELAAAVSASSGASDTSHTGIPSSLSGLLLQRVDQLSTKSKELLRTASVIGRQFDVKLATVDGPSRDLALKELQSTGLVIGKRGMADKLWFKHALIRDAVYDSLLDSDKRRLHAKVAHRLEDQYAGSEREVAEELARHFEIAGEPVLAARYAAVAGEKALELFALGDAGRWFQRCLALFPEILDPEDEARRVETVSNLIQVTCWDARFDEMLALSDQELQRARTLGENSMVSRLLSWLGEAYLHGGRLDDSHAVLQKALAIAEKLGDEPGIAHALAELAWLRSITDTPKERTDDEEFINRAFALGTAHDDSLVCTFAMYADWTNACHDGRLADSRKAASALIEFGERTGYPPAKCWGACLAAHSEALAGNAAAALRYNERAAGEVACAYDQLVVDLCRTVVLETLGHHEAAVEAFEAAGRDDSAVGMFYFGYASVASWGRSLIETGRVDDGERVLNNAIKRFQNMGHARAAAMATIALGNGLSGIAGREADTEAVFESGARLAEVSGMMGLRAHAAAALGYLYSQSGRVDGARALFDEAKAIAAPLDWLTLEQRINATAAGLAGPFSQRS